VVEVRRTIFNVHPTLGCWRRVEVGFVADVLSEHIASIIRTSTPVLETICSPETSAKEPNPHDSSTQKQAQLFQRITLKV
jgi:hypothetical protein